MKAKKWKQMIEKGFLKRNMGLPVEAKFKTKEGIKTICGIQGDFTDEDVRINLGETIEEEIGIKVKDLLSLLVMTREDYKKRKKQN